MTRYVVQGDDGVVELAEDDLMAKLRGEELTGLELARPVDDEAWRPLHELPVFRQAVPHVGDPRDVARRRVAKGFGWHVLVYAAVAGWFLGVTSLPGLIWGFFVLTHAFKALPVTWSLVREGKLLGPGPSARALPAAGASSPAALPGAGGSDAGTRDGAGSPAALPAAVDAGAAPAIATEADLVLADVRSMLARRPGHATEDAAGFDGVAQALRELRDRVARLSALLAGQDRGALEERLDAARRALDEATDPADEALRRREVDVLRESLATNERARKALERLQLRERVAVQELQQLRLELARAEADASGLDDLGERLDQIRFETEAATEVDALVGGRP